MAARRADLEVMKVMADRTVPSAVPRNGGSSRCGLNLANASPVNLSLADHPSLASSSTRPVHDYEGGALSIFAPPPPSDTLPEALQGLVEPIVHIPLAESRLRPARTKDMGVRTGVSASGKGVKVGARAGTPVGRRKGKDLVSITCRTADYSRIKTSVHRAGVSADSCAVMAVRDPFTSCASSHRCVSTNSQSRRDGSAKSAKRRNRKR
jgi:hypothetical protein